MAAAAATLESELIGLRVTAMMQPPAADPNAAPLAIEGTVYSINAPQDIIILMTGESPPNNNVRTSFRVVKMAYVKELRLAPAPAPPPARPGDPAPQHRLPSGIAPCVALPTLHSDGTESLERRINGKKKTGDESRKYTGLDPDLAIRTLDVLDALSRVFPDARWNVDKNCISVGKDIAVQGIPNWKAPKVTAGADSAEAVGRVQKVLEAAKAKEAAHAK